MGSSISNKGRTRALCLSKVLNLVLLLMLHHQCVNACVSAVTASDEQVAPCKVVTKWVNTDSINGLKNFDW